MVKIASCQLTSACEIKARKSQIQDILLKCEIEHIEFICFPEGFLTGYYAEEDIARKNSLVVGEDSFEEWLKLFRTSTATIIVGFNEREGSHIFDSAAIIDNGKLLGVQRKHYLYHHYFTPGVSFSPYSSKGITFGVVICLDMNYFEPARLLSLQGATILFSPMCNLVKPSHPYVKRPPYYSQFVARSHENRCWLITADWVLPHNEEKSVCPGHSCIYDPDGKEMKRSREYKEDLLIIDIPNERLFEDKGRRVLGSPLLAQALCKGSFNCRSRKLEND